MGKKRKSNKGKSPGIAHKEAFQRMSFLYQAAHSALTSTPNQPQLARFYIHTMKTISKRLVLKIDPTIKRTLCKSCDTLLLPGITATHRVRASREKYLVVRCLTCGGTKRFLAREGYKLWSERFGAREDVEVAKEVTTIAAAAAAAAVVAGPSTTDTTPSTSSSATTIDSRSIVSTVTSSPLSQ